MFSFVRFVYIALCLTAVECTPWGHREGQCGARGFCTRCCRYMFACASARVWFTGNWQEEYSKYHSSVLLGVAPRKYLVVETFSGLADSLALITGMLFVAVLSKRALQIQEDLPFMAAYDQPNIDWQWVRYVSKTFCFVCYITSAARG